MADRSALGKLGFAFGAVTAAVMLMAAVVVAGHLDGRLSDDGGSRAAAPALSTATR
ncbi:MAG TPA: hypothetical protein VEK73_01625 [Xanthobacteraceae bacterium]|nr:hypothetical protein [Xanthobacteraceae bacterium]